jgi:hypothetical protein
MMAASVRRAPSFEVTANTGLFRLGSGGFGAVGGRAWDVSPRDGRFLSVRRPPSPPSGLRVVLGWTQELREAMER